ncbi:MULTISPECIES: hypothetical protein [Pseudomonas syringae group]|uniref:PD-(D/E)XK nuclease domain-containing protein n=1 Tax=Pseudomonas syringae group TaxID=136849 RepID=UPI000894D099|nr:MULTISPECIES: hypothetical protein [Pseudomonas syringae group]MBI6742740.1 hypothetical protein [Pseudomonas syringae]MBI6763405.1 hypothetical protein [Pseudomonas syringae]MBI6829637.1 hypothetical protein [Pseudomonas syringae]RMN43668.1 hypothetical protein ALQ59_02364 [Pseudomonas syringae pv. apii]RMN52801.1 hypothetical protein ALQ58_200031 [Pseudomonas syringae pv. apii]
MHKWIRFFYSKKEEDNESIGEMILQTRRYRLITKISSTILVLMPVVFYVVWISPRFEEPSVTNPAVIELMSTDEYKYATSEAFERINRYNRGEINADELQGIRAVHQVRGVVVRLKLDPVPRNEPRESGGMKYKIDAEYNISIALGHFVLLFVVELAIVAIALVTWLGGEPKARLEYEDRILQAYFSFESHAPTRAETGHNIVVRALARFHRFAKDLEDRPRNADGITVQNEYDVQYLVNALLRLEFDNVKPEEYAPSMASGATRLDFLLPDHDLVLEIKMTHDSKRMKSLVNELILDIGRYRAHPGCSEIIFFVYDPRGLMKNPVALQKELTEIAGNLPVTLFVSPRT